MSNLNLSTESINKMFFKFAIPSIVGLLIVSMQTMIDGIFVANFVGARGLAAINISMPYINTIMSVGMMIISGGGVISSIYLGQNNKKRAGEVATFTLISTVVTLSIVAGVSLLFIDKLIIFLGADQILYTMVKAYLMPMLFLTIFFNAPIYTETFARIGGKPNSVFLSGFVCCTSNITLNYLFIVVLNLGISGAAYATGIANLLGALALICNFFNERLNIQFYKPQGDIKLLKAILYNGSSEMLTVVAASVSTFLFNRIIMSYIGELGVSALTIVFYVNNIVNISLYGLSQALQPIVSFNLGACKSDRIFMALRISLVTGGIIGLLSFIAMKNYSLPLVRLFTKGDVELTSLATNAIGYFVFAYLLSFINIIAVSFHTAIEKPLESALIALLRSLVFVSGLLYILPIFLGEKGIWMAIPIAELLCLFISLFMMKKSFVKIEKSLANKEVVSVI